MGPGRLIGRPLPLVLVAALAAVGLAILACGGGEEPEAFTEADLERFEASKTVAQESFGERLKDGAGSYQVGDTAVIDTAVIKNSTHQDVTVSAGSAVEWRNDDGFDHTTTAGTPDEPSDLWDSGPIEPGSTFTFEFEQAGEYKYFCSIHNFMTATVTVTQ